MQAYQARVRPRNQGSIRNGTSTHLDLTGQVVVTDHDAVGGSEAPTHLRIAVFYLYEFPVDRTACLRN